MMYWLRVGEACDVLLVDYTVMIRVCVANRACPVLSSWLHASAFFTHARDAAAKWRGMIPPSADVRTHAARLLREFEGRTGLGAIAFDFARIARQLRGDDDEGFLRFTAAALLDPGVPPTSLYGHAW